MFANRKIPATEILLIGDEGTGKTEVTRCLSESKYKFSSEKKGVFPSMVEPRTWKDEASGLSFIFTDLSGAEQYRSIMLEHCNPRTIKSGIVGLVLDRRKPFEEQIKRHNAAIQKLREPGEDKMSPLTNCMVIVTANDVRESKDACQTSDEQIAKFCESQNSCS